MEKNIIGELVVKKEGEEVTFIENVTEEEVTKTVERKKILTEDTTGRITKYALDDPNAVYVLWDRETHSERINISELKFHREQ